MSDSDETVCNDSGEENTNTQNSPSILSNWHQGEDVCSTQKEDGPKTIAKNKQDTERHENRQVYDPNPYLVKRLFSSMFQLTYSSLFTLAEWSIASFVS